ncbi:hypothetical protein QFZ27_001681 [Inquilinus ginsengisoli]|uniref:hypothetical protein n=1 Tax=Inquilinus ginsengisoli TaxID=363840 RepID=UPI003D1F340F
MRDDDAKPRRHGAGSSAAILQLGVAHPDARIDREDGRTARGRLQRQAMRAGHLATKPGVRDQLVVTEAGRAMIERAAATGRQYRDQLDRFMRDHADHDGPRRALADGAPAAVATAITRIRQEEEAALARLRATLQA